MGGFTLTGFVGSMKQWAATTSSSLSVSAKRTSLSSESTPRKILRLYSSKMISESLITEGNESSLARSTSAAASPSPLQRILKLRALLVDVDDRVAGWKPSALLANFSHASSRSGGTGS